jgi:hypothetical protein
MGHLALQKMRSALKTTGFGPEMTGFVLRATGLEPPMTGLAPCHPVRAFEFDQGFVNSAPAPSRF